MRLNKKLVLFFIVCALFTISSVSAIDNQTSIIGESDYHTFSELNQSIADSGDKLDLEYNYKYDNTSININKNVEFTINGNNHIIEGIKDENAFNINSTKTVTINNLIFKNCINTTITINSPVIFNNVQFINCTGFDTEFAQQTQGNHFIKATENVTFNNCTFHMSDGNYQTIGCSNEGNLIINNSVFDSGSFFNGCIYVNRCDLLIENTTFTNLNSKVATAINYKGWNFTLRNSKFINLHSNTTGGTIVGKYFPYIIYDHETQEIIEILPNGPFLIENCEFINTTSTSNGGAIHFDLDSGSQHKIQTLNLINNSFIDCESKFGGAITNMGGILNISNSKFLKNCANFSGGAIYTTWSNVFITNCTLTNNSAQKNAGAIYFDKKNLTIINSSLTNNIISKVSNTTANGIYAYDASIYFANTTFNNGGVGVYANFAADSKLENITKNEDVFLLDNKNYIVSVESKGIKLNLTNNTIIVDELPSKFNLDDWGWVSPLKLQGDNFDCWAFATVASLESALLKSTSVLYDLSPNYVQKLQLKYNQNGDLRNSITGFSYSGLGYALSWYGILQSDNFYDDRGMITDTDLNDERIHLQDALIIFGGKNDTEDQIKRAIMKYGAVCVQLIIGDFPADVNSTGEDIACADHSTHFLSFIGWDDEKQVWFVKDSEGVVEKLDYKQSGETLFKDDIFAIVPQNAIIAYIFENNIDYHVNYQTDLTGLVGFDGNYTFYSNEFTSKYSELIGAVGTYFNESGINYSFDIYVNGVKKYSQSGVSEFAGFRTIILNNYVHVNAGDVFKVVFKNHALPYQAYSRQHYVPGMSMVSENGTSWRDITLDNKTVCLKVYTVKDDTKIINNKDISIDYLGGSYYSVKVVTADGHAVVGAAVKFTIAGKTYTIKTDANGIAKIKINLVPNKYTVTASCNGKQVKNIVTVKQVIKTSPVSVKKTAKKFNLKATLKINGKLVKDKVITFKFNGKTYKVKTNSKGIAQKTFSKNTIKKLKKSKTYTVKVIYGKTSVKTTVKVK